MNILRYLLACAVIYAIASLPAYASNPRSGSGTPEEETSLHRSKSVSSASVSSARQRRHGGKHKREQEDHHDDGREDEKEGDDRRNRRPKAKLRIKNLTRDPGVLNWIRLDARKSKDRDGRISSYRYRITTRDTRIGVHSPAPTGSRVAHVKLPPGEYIASVTVTDDQGASRTRYRHFAVRGEAVEGFRANRVEWALGEDWQVGDPSLVIAIPLLPLDLQEMADIFSPTASLTTEGLGASSSGGCGSTLTKTGEAVPIATGFVSMIPGAGPLLGPVNAAGATMRLIGGNKSSACTQAEITSINDQLKYQEQQIQDIYTTIYVDQQDFMADLLSLAIGITDTNENSYDFIRNEVSDKFSEFMVTAGLWSPDISHEPVAGADIEQLASDTSFLGASYKLSSWAADNFDLTDDLDSLSGSTYKNTDPTCQTDCYVNVQRTNAIDSILLTLQPALANELRSEIGICLSSTNSTTSAPTSCNSDGTSNIIPLYESYNTTLVTYYQQSLYGLQQGYMINYLINQFNYYAHLAPNETLYSQIDQISSARGTWFDLNAYIGATIDERDSAYTEVQKQLTLAYAARVNRLYENTLNYIISDVPASHQSYPVIPPDIAGRSILEKIDLANVVGSEIPNLGSGTPILKRTPILQVTTTTGAHTASPNGVLWTDSSVLYQFSMQDMFICNRNREAFNASSEDNDFLDAFANPDDCPSVFALPDGSPVNGGFYDGQMLQPYSYEVAPGGGPCPDSCQAPQCMSGQDDGSSNWTTGGQPLAYVVDDSWDSPAGDNGDWQTSCDTSVAFFSGSPSATPPTLCTSCKSNVPATDWDSLSGDNGSWQDSCKTDEATLSGAAGVENALPTLCASCEETSGDYADTNCETCRSGRWGNAEGTLFCEDAPAPDVRSGPSVDSCASCRSGRWSSNDQGELVCDDGDSTLECRGFCSGWNFCGDYNYAVVSSEAGRGFQDCNQCGSYPVLSLGAPMRGNVKFCANGVVTANDPDGDAGNQMTWYRLPESYAGNLAELQQEATHLSCGNWLIADSLDTTLRARQSGSVPNYPTQPDPVSSYSYLDEQNSSGQKSIITLSTDAFRYGNENPCGPCESPSLYFDSANPFCEFDTTTAPASSTGFSAQLQTSEFNACGQFEFNNMQGHDTFHAGFSLRQPNLATDLRSGGISIPLAVVKQCDKSTCRDGPIHQDVTNVISMAPLDIYDSSSGAITPQDITENGYLCGPADNNEFTCSLIDGREFLMSFYQQSSVSVDFRSIQTNVGCPSGCYECNPGTGGFTPGGQDLIIGSDGRLVCNGFCSGADNCGDVEYFQYDSGGDLAPLDCRQCN